MPIRETPTVSALRTQEYLATKDTITAIKRPFVLGSDCCFCYPNCNWTLPRFSNLLDQSDTYKNDRDDFIVQVPLSGTVTGTLIKIAPDGTETSFVIVDDTYGDFFSTGTIKANVWAFILDWYKVADVIGYGTYKFNILIENGASTELFNQDSVKFKLENWTCKCAHRTIKIKTEQSGYFEGGFDYTGISFEIPLPNGKTKVSTTWPQEIRLYGRFYREAFEQERDNIVTEERGQQLIQSKIWKRYRLKLDTIETKLSNRVILDMLQAPEVYISDYQINAIEFYQDVRVDLKEVDEPVNFTQNINEFIEFSLVDWQQDNVHRFK